MFSSDSDKEWGGIVVSSDVVYPGNGLIGFGIDPLGFEKIESGASAGGGGIARPCNDGIRFLGIRLPRDPVDNVVAVVDGEFVGFAVGVMDDVVRHGGAIRSAPTRSMEEVKP